MEKQQLLRKLLLRWISGVLGILVMLFLPAGSFSYWPAWVFCGVIFLPMVFTGMYFYRKDPAFLERRMKMREEVTEQKWIIGVTNLFFLAIFLLPGFDYRFGWSHVPTWLILTANAVVFLSYLLVVRVFKENSYASRVIEVEEGQKVISTGPYAVVRHPMYVGVLLMFLFSPLALGSYWTLLPFAALPFLLALRLLNEEKVLREELPGYTEYCEKVRYRLIPFVW